MSSITTAAVHEKPADTIEKESTKIQKMIRIQLQMMLLMMMTNHLKHQEKIILMSLHQVSKLFLGTTSTQKIFTRNVHIPVKKNLHQENNVFVLK